MPTELEVLVYARVDGRSPFAQWLRAIPDGRTRHRIRARIARLRLGHLGDTRSVGAGVHELRMKLGPGIRLYFGRETPTRVVLLWGGAKRTQVRDIQRARAYWQDHRARREIEE